MNWTDPEKTWLIIYNLIHSAINYGSECKSVDTNNFRGNKGFVRNSMYIDEGRNN